MVETDELTLRASRRSWLFTLAAFCAFVALLASCAFIPVPGGHESEVRKDVPGVDVLYPAQVFPSVGSYERTKRDIEPAEFDQDIDPYWDKGHADWFVTSWDDHGVLHLQQWVGKWTDPNYAAWGYDSLDPRSPLTDERYLHIGPWLKSDAPGNPDSSRIFCAGRIRPSLKQCGEWKWWARYGQYTVEFVASADAPVDVEHGGESDSSPMSQTDFESFVRLLAEHVDSVAPMKPHVR